MNDKSYETAGLSPATVDHLQAAAERIVGESHGPVTQGVMFELVAALCCEIARLARSVKARPGRCSSIQAARLPATGFVTIEASPPAEAGSCSSTGGQGW